MYGVLRLRYCMLLCHPTYSSIVSDYFMHFSAYIYYIRMFSSGAFRQQRTVQYVPCQGTLDREMQPREIRVTKRPQAQTWHMPKCFVEWTFSCFVAFVITAVRSVVCWVVLLVVAHYHRASDVFTML